MRTKEVILINPITPPIVWTSRLKVMTNKCRNWKFSYSMKQSNVDPWSPSFFILGSWEYFGILSCPMCSHQVSKCVPQDHLHFHLHVFTWFKMNLHDLTLSTLTYPRLGIYIHECWYLRGFTIAWNINKFLIHTYIATMLKTWM